MSLIELHDLSVTYNVGDETGTRTLTVLNQINLSIETGEMVAILGPSGSGKSTLLYILGCLLKATSGAHTFEGFEINSLSSDGLAYLRGSKIGFVFQQFHLLPRANLMENVMLAHRYASTDAEGAVDLASVEQRALSLLENVGLSSHLHHKPNQLSGGQQQRLAIARALLNQPSLILADEPTGNLDSKSTQQVLDLLQKIHASGQTVVIITHDPQVAARCERVLTINDGHLVGGPIVPESNGPDAKGSAGPHKFALGLAEIGPARSRFAWSQYVQTAFQNLLRNKARSFLTMLGVTIGIAAVLSTITLGGYTRTKILQTYETLGVNKLVIRAYPRWRMKAIDIKGPKFDGISQENDIVPLRKLFPDIKLVSPVVQDWSVKSVEFGGHSFDQVRLQGVSTEYFAITNRYPMIGQVFSLFHMRNHSRVCVIGYEIATKLFGHISPLRQILQINGDDKQYSCLVIGVMPTQVSNNEWFKPDQQILVPDSFLSIMASKWSSKPYEMDLRARTGASLEDLSKEIKQYFILKYGRSVEVHVDSDQLLVAQMRKFLNLFAMLLSGVAFLSLAVGGIGITNMMLISVAERFKEIGLRKALGARDHEIRVQFLIEAVVLCGLAGLIGIIIGVVGYHSMLYLASKLSSKIQFEWIFDFPAMLLSLVCILAVGIASGIVPALRAERLEVVEALRSE